MTTMTNLTMKDMKNGGGEIGCQLAGSATGDWPRRVTRAGTEVVSLSSCLTVIPLNYYTVEPSFSPAVSCSTDQLFGFYVVQGINAWEKTD
jgi:hypothetical protein